jgi:hypothetical protein
MDNYRIDSEIKQRLEESKDFYSPRADIAKDRIWGEIQKNRPVRKQAILIRILAVACVLLIVFSSVLMNSLSTSRKSLNALTELSKASEERLNNKMVQLNRQLAILSQKQNDTVVITKKEIVYLPQIKKETIRDTVYLRELVYMDPDTRAPAPVNEARALSYEAPYPDTLLFNTEFKIQRTNTNPQKPKRRFMFRFINIQHEVENDPYAISMQL